MIALFVIACGLCILETAANPYSTILGPPASAAQRLNLSQSFNGLGWILGPLVGGLLIFGAPEGDSMALTKPYILVGGIVLFVALLFFFTKLPEIKPEEEEEVTAIVEEKPLPPYGNVGSLYVPWSPNSVIAPRRRESSGSLLIT